MKHIFIVNPVAGSRNIGTELPPQIISAATVLGKEYVIRLTEAPGHAGELAREYAASGEPVRLYACGGDGTLNEVLQIAAEFPNAAVGCVPCGSGNDFVRNFGDKKAFLDFSAMLNGREAEIDLLRTPYGYAASSCSAGLDAQVAMGIDRWRRLPGCGGSLSYIISAAEQICGKLGIEMEIELDDKRIKGEYLLAAACNGMTYGGGFRAAPLAQMDDGLMDVILVRKIPRRRILSVIGAYRNGTHIRDGEVTPRLRDALEYYRAKRVSIRPAAGARFVVNVDGECAERAYFSAEVCHRIVRVVLPPDIFAAWAARPAQQAPVPGEPGCQ